MPPFIFISQAKRKHNDYVVTSLNDEVVSDDFLFNSDAAVVVATPNKVKLAIREQAMKSPLKDTAGTPSKRSRK